VKSNILRATTMRRAVFVTAAAILTLPATSDYDAASSIRRDTTALEAVGLLREQPRRIAEALTPQIDK
jgi:hypothetical protein